MKYWTPSAFKILLLLTFLIQQLVLGNNKHRKDIHAPKIQPPPFQFLGPTISPQTTQANACRNLMHVLAKKKRTAISLKEKVEQLTKDIERGAKNADYADSQRTILNIFSKQLNYNEQIIYQTIDWLTQSLDGKFKDYKDMKASIETRLKALRDATFQEEQGYSQLLLAEKYINKTKEMNEAQEEGGILAEILSQVAQSADELEYDLGDIIPEDVARRQRILGKNGENMETLVRINTNKEDVQRLADANGNQFVMSKGQDSTQPLEDTVLLLDLVYIMVGSTVLSYITSLIGLPAMFGQVVCGVILGPSALNILSSIVQIETLAELGVFFIMFTVGLEFSPSRIRQILFVSVLGSFGLMAILVLCGLLLTLVISASTFGETAFIGACFSLSSTPLVIKFTAPTGAVGPHEEIRAAARREYTEVLLGILVLQDVLMGLLVAFLPALAGRGTMLSSAGLLGHIILAFLLMTLLSAVIVKLIQKVKPQMLECSGEMLTLISTGLAFVMMWVTFQLGISMELGCFLAGSMISAGGDNLASKVEPLVSPIKDFLSCIFFTAIGLHVFPSFVMLELGFLALATVLVVTFKFGASAVVMSFCLPHQSQKYSYIVAAGLSQVSEYSFVLSSRARHLQLISREVYLLVLSVSTLSLLMAPFLWKITLATENTNPRMRAVSGGSRSTSRQNSVTSS